MNNPYRAGPWPGLTPNGAGVLLGCAAFLWIGQALVGVPRQPVPDIPVVGVTALLPLVIAVRITQVPGAASAVCAAYLVPASVLALFRETLAQPPLLLVPAMAFDVAVWVLPVYLKQVPAHLYPLIAGAVFGAIFGLVEPPFRLFLGGEFATWTGSAVWISVVATSASCAVIAPVLSARGTAA